LLVDAQLLLAHRFLSLVHFLHVDHFLFEGRSELANGRLVLATLGDDSFCRKFLIEGVEWADGVTIVGGGGLVSGLHRGQYFDLSLFLAARGRIRYILIA